MLELLPIDRLYPNRPFFHDFVARRENALRFLENASQSDLVAPERAAQVGVDEDLRRKLRQSNLALGASDATLANIDALASATTLCVQTGQQPGMLGGPLFTTYKIIAAIRTARAWSDRLNVRVVPIYWLASHDHDLNEVNHVHWLGADSEVAAARFRWHEEGHRLDALPITGEATEIAARYFDRISGSDVRGDQEQIRRLFTPSDTDSFCQWHARIWLRLFSAYGLIIADPCSLPPPVLFYRNALRLDQEIKLATTSQCRQLQDAGYPPPFPEGSAGGLFIQDKNDRRVRVTHPDRILPDLAERASDFSPDAVLRPILADWWFPTAVNVLGPGEITYHAALRQLYQLFGLRQPPAAFRLSLSVLGAADRTLIRDLGFSLDEALTGGINVRDAGWRIAPDSLRAVWNQQLESMDESLKTVGTEANRIDPGLDRSVGTARGGVTHALDRLELRMLRALLAKHGVSPARLSGLSSLLRPGNHLQERIFALPEFLVRHGCSLTDRILELEPLPSDCHGVMTIDEAASRRDPVLG